MAATRNSNLDDPFYQPADKFFPANHKTGLTFDDITLATLYSEILPRDTQLETELADSLRLNIPVISSDMDTVTESRMAIAMALNGGLGLIHYNMAPKDQVKEVARDRVLDDRELAQVILAARKIGGPYGGIVELLALTGQRREEVAGLPWEELDLAQRIWTIPRRTKNAKAHIVHLSRQALTVLKRAGQRGPLVFSLLGTKRFQHFTHAKRRLDQLSGVTRWRLHDLRRTCVSGMARLGVAPHVADKILNHQSGTISGVAAVYQRHEFLAERRTALDLWGAHVDQLLRERSHEQLKKVA